jgi:hypothetical protein
MKLGNGILKTSIQDLLDSLVLTDDLVFQRRYFGITTPNIQCLYQHDAASDDHDDLPLQNRSSLQNNELLKIAVLIATNEYTKETSHAIIDYGSSCCFTSYIAYFLHQPTPIINTTLTQNTTRKQRKHNLDHRQCHIRTIMPHPTNQFTTITQTIESKRT